MAELSYRFVMEKIQNRSKAFLLNDNSVLFYGQGQYDEYCLYKGVSVWDGSTQSFITMCAPVTDNYYYEILQTMTERYGIEKIYFQLICRLYNSVSNIFDENILMRLKSQVDHLGIHSEQDKADLYEALAMVYYGMVGEENHMVNGQPAVCGKLLKMYALYLLLMKQVPIGTNANPGVCQMLRGQSPQVILQEASTVGIFRQVVVLYL